MQKARVGRQIPTDVYSHVELYIPWYLSSCILSLVSRNLMVIIYPDENDFAASPRRILLFWQNAECIDQVWEKSGTTALC